MKFIKRLALPLLLLGAVLMLYLIWLVLDLPAESELMAIAQDYYNRYGLLTVFVSALMEGLVFVGVYYPGSLVIFLGVIFAGKDIGRVIEVVAVVDIGLELGCIINFFLGKYGWYRVLLKFGLKEPLQHAQQRLKHHEKTAYVMSFWQPSLAAFTSTAAGILQLPFWRFFLFSFGIGTAWSVFWGALIYFLGEASLGIVGLRFVLVALAVWILIRLVFSKPPLQDQKIVYNSDPKSEICLP